MKTVLSAIALILLLSACDKENNANTTCKVSSDSLAKSITITQGIWGVITFTEGNCMPTIGTNSSCKSYPVKRKIFIHAYTTTNDVVKYNGAPYFFTQINTAQIATTTTNECGFFEINLPPGKYSIFVEEDGKFYANSFDGQTGINPIELKTEVQQHAININYKAVY